MNNLKLEQISVHYDGAAISALENVSLDLSSGEFVILTGRSGCGKTSLLNVAAGLLAPQTGAVTRNGLPLCGPGQGRAVVFQHDALFPWFNTRENVAFALRLRGKSQKERQRIANNLLAQVRLEGVGDKAIWELSGGMRQRVGLARALASEPDFLLMDEPLGALDALTRERMQTLLLDIWSRYSAGVLMVTHGIEEALFLATKIVVMLPHPGRIAQVFNLDFGRRYLAGEPVREIKADPLFVQARAELEDAIFEGEIV
ncbi:taurine ABC transporter ATP-binding protein [Brucella gallinifaecis]|uniref:ATP-binding cassette domain-containing protein n=1 Tax=Brucella gallinifaecis TaxID=215590 RepID=A0A502BM02_9HYPH|nr:ATP-binding cassette domain-containing protein [Brucella gallinifaecis]TPF74719.1 ATP-binding cassette domain-containing protein [Brucella gallinifaecis]